jgi:hypothetical protein
MVAQPDMQSAVTQDDPAKWFYVSMKSLEAAVYNETTTIGTVMDTRRMLLLLIKA